MREELAEQLRLGGESKGACPSPIRHGWALKPNFADKGKVASYLSGAELLGFVRPEVWEATFKKNDCIIHDSILLTIHRNIYIYINDNQ